MCIFPEKRCGETLAVDTVPHNVDQNHVYDSRFYRVEDPVFGVYYRGEHITGDYTILLPR